MRSFVLALCAVLLSVSGLAHAKTATAADLRKLVAAAPHVAVKRSTASNSTWVQVMKATDATPTVFKKFVIEKKVAIDNGSTGYILKVATSPYAMVKPNTAYVISTSIAGQRMYKAQLQGN